MQRGARTFGKASKLFIGAILSSSSKIPPPSVGGDDKPLARWSRCGWYIVGVVDGSNGAFDC